MNENKHTDKKSLRFFKGANTDWDELTKDCVCFANARGGLIFIGVEDGDSIPPKNQRIEDRNLPEKIQKNISQRSINVGIAVTIEVANNGADFIRLEVFRNAQTIASTTDGRYYTRIHDECKPIPPDEMARLAADKNAFVWEEQINKRIPTTQFDPFKRQNFLTDIRRSARVSDFIKEMSDEDILDFYFFQKEGYLTNLGILWIGLRPDRASLLYPPAIQVIRYNENEEKVWKLLLDEYFKNPKELLDSVINEVPDWQESIEISEGMFRKNVHFFPIAVVRELVVNALVHRTYTMRGDIFINIFPDRLEIHSPGRLPFGVTPKNILSQSVRRNEHLSKVFYDLGLMEKEGSGFDLVYANLLSTGKPIPIVKDLDDRVTVIIKKQFISKQVIQLMDKASSEYNLKQRELITLGLLAQQQSYTAIELSITLNQDQEQGLNNWLGRLLEFELVLKSGKGKGTQYAINPEYIRQSQFKGKTSLKNIEDHRLEELIYKDIKAYPESAFSDIHKRIGKEINRHKVRRMLSNMVDIKTLKKTGQKRWTRYSIAQNKLVNE